jgi:hypothetical protein
MGRHDSNDIAALVISRIEEGKELRTDIPLSTTTPDAIVAAVSLRDERDHLFLRVNGQLIALGNNAPVAALVSNFLRVH